MKETGTSQRRSRLQGVAVVLVILGIIAVVVGLYAHPLRRFIHESFMESVTSSHYEIKCPPGLLTQDAMRQFATQRETLFTTLDRKLDDAASNVEIQIVFDSAPNTSIAAVGSPQPYSVSGLTIRTTVNGRIPQLDEAADAEALLHAAWGKPGNARISQLAAVWLVGNWHGEELGMAAAAVEQHLGHKKVSSLLDPADGIIPLPEDRTLLGAAWLTQIAQLDGPAEVRKLYSAKTSDLSEADVTKALGTPPVELDRQWQMWIYSYLAGMPSQSQSMPMNMQMSGDH